MLGQLLHSLNSATRRSTPRSQDVSSQIEEGHTRALLFPDVPFLADALSPTTLASEPPDCHLQADLDLEASRDVRILIAQGETLTLQPLLLFDSKFNPSAESPRLKHTRTGSKSDGTPNHTRTASGPSRQLGKPPQIPSIPESNGKDTPGVSSPTTTGSMAQRSRVRRSSLPASTNPDLNAHIRQKEKDSDEVVKIALECMFENAPTTYKGISNKIKIVQREAKPYDSAVCRSTFGNQASNAQARPPNVRKLSTLSSSFSASEAINDPPRPDSSLNGAVIDDSFRPEPPRRTILITRTFSAKWSDDDDIHNAPAPEFSNTERLPSVSLGSAEAETGTSTENSNPQKPRRLVLPKATPKPPMFAITIVLSLPVSATETSRPTSRSGFLRRKGSEGVADWTSLGSSFDSNALMDPLFGLESSVASLSSDVDDRVDKVIGQHWDIIVRSLSTLQELAGQKIHEHLKLAILKGRPPKLLHHALALDPDIKKAADQTCSRIVRGMKILRVHTGQGRWGVWRDEARWLNKWAAEKERATFLFNLCTAFLGTHTEWLDIAGPRFYRQQHREQLRLGSPNEPAVPHRTIIVSADKMAARRLVFLLAAFLPANHQSHGDASPLRPSTSASIRAFSQSPPSHLPPSRKESLRRTINHRGKRSTSRRTESGGRTPQQSSSHSDTDDRTETGTVRSMENPRRHSRRGSGDLRNIMKAKLVVTEVDASTRKSSATTSPTVNNGFVVPAAHIGFQRKYSSGHDGMLRPSSRDSLASENLKQSLQRSNTTGSSDSQAPSRWGSLRSFWSMGSGRGSSTDYSDIAQNDDEGLGIMGIQQYEQGYNKLQRMVDEGYAEELRMTGGDGSVSPLMPTTPEIRSPELEEPLQSATSQPIDVPLKMTVNEQDGVIDVQFPGFSPINSPPAASQTGSSFGSLGVLQSLVSSSARNTGHAMNVAGWLRVGIHPDFELQATPPYSELLSDIRDAMRAEPSPITHRVLPSKEPKEEWVDVCTSLIADTTTFTIKRLRLRRRVRYLPPTLPTVNPMAPALRRGHVTTSGGRSQYGNPYTDEQLLQIPSQITLEEVFEEEKVSALDRALMDALERVIARSGPSSKMSSAASSRANSVRGRNGLPHIDDRVDTPEVPPSECKNMVIGALEQIATAVERDRRDARKYGGARLRSLNDETDSTLRDGIMKWYDEVERNKKAIEEQKLEILKEAKREAEKDGEASMVSSITLRPNQYRNRSKQLPSGYIQAAESKTMAASVDATKETS